jgi:hypothetical protein
MVTKGGGVTRTKHIRTRLHLVIEAVKEHVEICCMQMKVDGLTKALEGAVSFISEVLSLPDRVNWWT